MKILFAYWGKIGENCGHEYRLSTKKGMVFRHNALFYVHRTQSPTAIKAVYLRFKGYGFVG